MLTIDVGDLSAGEHTLTLGGFLNKKTTSDEETNISFDNVTFTVDGGTSEIASETVTVTPEVANVYDLDITTALTDTDGSESLSAITVGGLPEGTTLSAGSDLGGGSWSVPTSALDGLTMTTSDDLSEGFALTVSSTSTESSNAPTDSAVSRSRFPVGSSAKSSAGRLMSARQTATR